MRDPQPQARRASERCTLTSDASLARASGFYGNARIKTYQPLAELALILLLCFCYAGSPPPGVNEPHYLGKAKHYWDPAWCAGDFFLESADAHGVFYWTFGWTTQFLTLPAAAWVGRLAVWSLFALAWRTFVRGLTDVPWMSALSAGVYLALVRDCHMAGEWVVGGVEAKGFAYALVFWGLSAIVRGRWRLVWPTLGAAASFHVIVGGWAVVAAAFAWLVRRNQDNQTCRANCLPLLIGGLLSLPGLLPAISLTQGVPAEITQEANVIYVYRRLHHHLVFHRFSHALMARFAALFVAWLAVSRIVHPTPAYRRLASFVWGCLIIACVGIGIDQLLLGRYALSASLLRYYWFRLSDSMLPAGAAAAIVALLIGENRRALAKATLVAALAGAGLGLGHAIRDGGFVAIPAAEVQQRWPGSDGDGDGDRDAVDADWREACGWISQRVRTGTVFLTPPRQQTFKWFAHRAEFVTRKDVPQDARGLVQWQQRLIAVKALGDSPTDDPARLREMADEYGLTHVIWTNGKQKSASAMRPLFKNETFVVYDLHSN